MARMRMGHRRAGDVLCLLTGPGMLVCLMLTLLQAPVSAEPEDAGKTDQDRYPGQELKPRPFFSVFQFPRLVRPYRQSMMDKLMSPLSDFFNFGEKLLASPNEMGVNTASPDKGWTARNEEPIGTQVRIEIRGDFGNSESPQTSLYLKGRSKLAPHALRKAVKPLLNVIEQEEQRLEKSRKSEGDFLISNENTFPLWSGKSLSKDIRDRDLILNDGSLDEILQTEDQRRYSRAEDQSNDEGWSFGKIAYNMFDQQKNINGHTSQFSNYRKILGGGKDREFQGTSTVNSEGEEIASVDKNKTAASAETDQQAQEKAQPLQADVHILPEVAKADNIQNDTFLSIVMNSKILRQTDSPLTEENLAINKSAFGKSSSPQNKGVEKISKRSVGQRLANRSSLTNSRNRFIHVSNTKGKVALEGLDDKRYHYERTPYQTNLKIQKAASSRNKKRLENNAHSSIDDKENNLFTSSGSLRKNNEVENTNSSANSRDLKKGENITARSSTEAPLAPRNKRHKRHSLHEVGSISLPTLRQARNTENVNKNEQVIESGGNESRVTTGNSNDGVKSTGYQILEDIADVKEDLNNYLEKVNIPESGNVIDGISLSTSGDAELEIPRLSKWLNDGINPYAMHAGENGMGTTEIASVYDSAKKSLHGNEDYEIHEGDEESEDYTEGVEQLEFKKRRRRRATNSQFDKKQTEDKKLPSKTHETVKQPDKGVKDKLQQEQNSALEREILSISSKLDHKKDGILPRSPSAPQRKKSNHTSLLDQADVVFILKSKKSHSGSQDGKYQHVKGDGKAGNSEPGTGSGEEPVGKSSRHVPFDLPAAPKDDKKKGEIETTQASLEGPSVQRVTPARPLSNPSRPFGLRPHGGKPVNLMWKHHQETNRHGAAILCFLSIAVILFIVLILTLTKATTDSDELRRNDSSTALYVNYPHY